MAGVRQARQCDNAAGTSQMSDVGGTRGGGGGGGDGGGGDGRTTQVVPVATRAVSMRSCAGRVEKR